MNSIHIAIALSIKHTGHCRTAIMATLVWCFSLTEVEKSDEANFLWFSPAIATRNGFLGIMPYVDSLPINATLRKKKGAKASKRRLGRLGKPFQEK
jgi:hypothetical protein